MAEPQHDLQAFMEQVTHEMMAEYKRISARVLEDPGTAGDQGEENWANLLRDWLPSNYHVVTKGRILSYEGYCSPQIDVIVLKPTYPKALLNKKHYLSAAVVAAFECKITLRREHIRDAFRRCVEIRRNMDLEQEGDFMYGLLAHAHSWASEPAAVRRTVDKAILEYDQTHVEHPIETLDLVCIANLGTWYGELSIDEKERLVETYYFGPSQLETLFGDSVAIPQANPIGRAIVSIYAQLAARDDELKGISKYFQEAGLLGLGGGNPRTWPVAQLAAMERLAASETSSEEE